MSMMTAGDVPEVPPFSLMAGDEPERESAVDRAKSRSGPLFVDTSASSDCAGLLSRQVSGESEGASSTSSLLLEPGEARLPRRQPFVGFLRHAPPQQLLSGQLDLLLRRRCSQQEDEEEEVDSMLDADGDEKEEKAAALPRASPYVGFQRHAPPSPSLCFSSSSIPPLPALPRLPEASELVAGTCEHFGPCRSHAPATEAQRQWPGRLPEEVWTGVLGFAVELPLLGVLSRLSRGFPDLLVSHSVWAGRPVRISPALVPQLAPRLGKWLDVWQSSTKLILPRSAQLLSEVSRRAPGLAVEVAWRFDQHLKGDGVEVLKHGLVARRTSDEELVVLGDAALPSAPGRTPYLEVRLDERGEAIGDGLNDFGFGVTACDPEEIGELGAVADEVPRSWVVDFTAASVVLSVNNQEAAKGYRVTADDLHQGDRVGLRLAPGQVEVYINGRLSEKLVPRVEDCVPTSGLFPVIDLYGRTIQVSRTFAEEPLP